MRQEIVRKDLRRKVQSRETDPRQKIEVFQEVKNKRITTETKWSEKRK